jgi:MerR family transcriptional regulator/heat shock protein HspR
MDRTDGVYVMQVASMLTGLHPQTLRKYERAGLVEPSRNNTLRMYSEEDVSRLKMIKRLVDECGLNLAGVDIVLKLHSKVCDMQKDLASSTYSTGNSKLEQHIDELLEMMKIKSAGQE